MFPTGDPPRRVARPSFASDLNHVPSNQTFARSQASDPVTATLNASGAKKATQHDLRTVGVDCNLQAPNESKGYELQTLPERPVQTKGRRRWLMETRLGPNASGKARMRQPHGQWTLSALRGASSRDLMAPPSAPGQVGFPPTVNSKFARPVPQTKTPSSFRRSDNRTLPPSRRDPDACSACGSNARDGVAAHARSKGRAAIENALRTLRGTFTDRTSSHTDEVLAAATRDPRAAPKKTPATFDVDTTTHNTSKNDNARTTPHSGAKGTSLAGGDKSARASGLRGGYREAPPLISGAIAASPPKAKWFLRGQEMPLRRHQPIERNGECFFSKIPRTPSWQWQTPFSAPLGGRARHKRISI